MKVLLTGGLGQLGVALKKSFPSNIDLISFGRRELDLANSVACRNAVLEIRPDWVLNAGAYTAVDKAENEPDAALAVNAHAPVAFASALAEVGGRLLQVSTDFVFDGCAGKPYLVEHPVNPLCVYGATKAAGENAALQLSGARILRSSWVYGPIGKNFCLTMLRLHAARAASGESLQVVSDQVSCPTSTKTLALACWRTILLDKNVENASRLHWSDAGVASWYDFAVAIGEIAVEMGLLQKSALVEPIRSAEYPTLARRPSYSLLDCSKTIEILGLKPKHWRRELTLVLQELHQEQS